MSGPGGTGAGSHIEGCDESIRLGGQTLIGNGMTAMGDGRRAMTG
jgi:hypothetical protein